ncbi:hypothetical protein PC129_g4504 [Phytophthora cactorum]|uniref:Uncharacterized protein n=1 Tax=Phytophthora cactorum TaxID=29920 RepID=A0A329SG00_9STRA|nr:hypothetical protein Pcac1_g14919 [Phytophthora cactorum]KAG2833736.1 hypothetical protein PC112_g6384 [Phytophthora cactorum]KAG2835973.1 hypothetical protein PC111_g5252 [Phytophthora cactorum]KAG2862066.1 hypothetical protein PC113_g6663 [Phytophthora cactorum]KAG2919596.1 hypothetical protein PC114_g6444 [Phytophthora cactorum]
MAGSTAKKKGKRGRCAPRIDDSSDSDSDVALHQALSTPDSSRQQEDTSPKYPEKKKSSPVSSVKPGSDDINAPVEVSVAYPRFNGVFNSWDDTVAAFVSYHSDTFLMYKLRTSN